MKKEEIRIKPTDLRLGNWVIYDNRYFQVSMIAEVFPELNTVEFGIGVVDYNNIKPIPLSEDVLLKCPQLEKKTGKYGDYFCGVSHELLRIWFNERWIIGKKVEGVEYNTVIVSSNIHYLHQLQNIFPLLTQEELEVSLLF